MTFFKRQARVLFAVLVAAALTPGVKAQEAWLSTPESVAQFRQQVEAMRPVPSQFALAGVEDRTIPLGDRDIRIRIYDPGATAPQPV